MKCINILVLLKIISFYDKDLFSRTLYLSSYAILNGYIWDNNDLAAYDKMLSLGGFFTYNRVG